MGIRSKLNKLATKYEQNNHVGPMQIKAMHSGELYQQWQDAKDKEVYAPTAVEEAERKYYTYKYGKVFYDNHLKSKFKKDSEKLKMEIQGTHEKVMQSALEKLHYYETQTIYYKNLRQITETLSKQILQYLNQIKHGLSMDSTQQRETYYKDLQRMSTEEYNQLFRYVMIGFIVLQASQFYTYKYYLVATIIVWVLMYPRINEYIIYWFITPKTIVQPMIYTEDDNRIVYRGQSNIA